MTLDSYYRQLRSTLGSWWGGGITLVDNSSSRHSSKQEKNKVLSVYGESNNFGDQEQNKFRLAPKQIISFWGKSMKDLP